MERQMRNIYFVICLLVSGVSFSFLSTANASLPTVDIGGPAPHVNQCSDIDRTAIEAWLISYDTNHCSRYASIPADERTGEAARCNPSDIEGRPDRSLYDILGQYCPAYVDSTAPNAGCLCIVQEYGCHGVPACASAEPVVTPPEMTPPAPVPPIAPTITQVSSAAASGAPVLEITVEGTHLGEGSVLMDGAALATVYIPSSVSGSTTIPARMVARLTADQSRVRRVVSVRVRVSVLDTTGRITQLESNTQTVELIPTPQMMAVPSDTTTVGAQDRTSDSGTQSGTVDRSGSSDINGLDLGGIAPRTGGCSLSSVSSENISILPYILLVLVYSLAPIYFRKIKTRN